MKRIRTISLIILLVSLFASIDLGFNFLYNLVPEYLDGYTSHSTLQWTIWNSWRPWMEPF